MNFHRILPAAALGALSLLFASPGVGASVPGMPPAAPAYPPEQFQGRDYRDAREVAGRFGFTTQWLVRGKSLRLQSRWTRIDLTVDSQEILINDLHVHLSEPVAGDHGTLYISQGDVTTLLTPVLAPQVASPPPVPRTVVIDPGHGGNDHGNENERLKLSEKVFTLDVAKRLARLLTADGFRVVMTRTDDRRVELDDRTEIARKAKADLFVSIHFNSFTQPGVAGAETYVMTPRNERSSPQPERDKAMMKTGYPGNGFDHWNMVLGYQMHRELIDGLHAADRGLKRFRYLVLRMCACPAVLVEAGFLSNETEGRKVNTPAYRQQIAEAIGSGVNAYAATIKRLRSTGQGTPD